LKYELLSTLTLTLFEPDYRWIMCCSQCKLQPCTNTAVAKWSFSLQQLDVFCEVRTECTVDSV